MSRVVRVDLRFARSSLGSRSIRSFTALRFRTGSGDLRRQGDVRSGTSTFASVSQMQQNVASTEHGDGGNIEDQESVPQNEIEPPHGELAIVFTDIVKSTYIWDHAPEGMEQAMTLHDDMLRSVSGRHQGYEVKQNGDGFMIAFQSAVAALEFTLEAQEQLLDLPWPEQLLDVGAGSEVKAKDDDTDQPEVVFKGLRLRMACHWGQPVTKWNDTVGRMDYLGPVVNRAARFIEATEGGQVVVSETFLQALGRSKNGSGSEAVEGDGPLFASIGEDNGDADDDSLGQKVDLKDIKADRADSILRDKRFEVRLLGKRHFKGVSDIQKLYFLIPQSLHGRLQFWPQHRSIPGSKGNLVEPA